MIYLLLTSVLLFVGTSIWAIRRVGRMKNKTISQHIAKDRLAQMVFGINCTIASTIAGFVLFAWILPHHNANTLSYIAFAFLMLFFIATALIPQVENTWRARGHFIAAWGMCFTIPLIILLTLFWNLSLAMWIAGIVTFIAVVLLLVLLMTWKNLRNNFLAFQSLYLSIFFIYLFILSI